MTPRRRAAAQSRGNRRQSWADLGIDEQALKSLANIVLPESSPTSSDEEETTETNADGDTGSSAEMTDAGHDELRRQIMVRCTHERLTHSALSCTRAHALMRFHWVYLRIQVMYKS